MNPSLAGGYVKILLGTLWATIMSRTLKSWESTWSKLSHPPLSSEYTQIMLFSLEPSTGIAHHKRLLKYLVTALSMVSLLIRSTMGLIASESGSSPIHEG